MSSKIIYDKNNVFTDRHAAPFAAVAGQALGREAGFLADYAFGTAGQIPLPPVVRVSHRRQILARQVSRVFLAVCDREILAIHVYVTLAYYENTVFYNSFIYLIFQMTN